MKLSTQQAANSEFRHLVPHVSRYILRSVTRDITGNMGLQICGLYLLIVSLAIEGTDPTTSALVEHSRTAPQQIANLAKYLLDLEIVFREQVHASHGRGRLHAYYPVTDIEILKKLLNRQKLNENSDS